MYVPSQFNESDSTKLHALIGEYPLSTWIVMDAVGVTVNHLPLLCDVENNCLIGHVARANPVWQSDTKRCMAIFHGPQGYVSPSWYPIKQEHHRAVPTWNYAVVHVQGWFEPFHDPALLSQHLAALTHHHEAQLQQPWKLTDAPSEYLDKMMVNIVGIKINIERLEGKFKLGQNRSEADQQGLVAGLRAVDNEASRALATFTEREKRSRRAQ